MTTILFSLLSLRPKTRALFAYMVTCGVVTTEELSRFDANYATLAAELVECGYLEELFNAAGLVVGFKPTEAGIVEATYKK